MAKKKTTTAKHKAISQYFFNLYDNKRKRYDDCLKETANHFFYSVSTIENILREQKKEAVDKLESA